MEFITEFKIGFLALILTTCALNCVLLFSYVPLNYWAYHPLVYMYRNHVVLVRYIPFLPLIVCAALLPALFRMAVEGKRIRLCRSRLDSSQKQLGRLLTSEVLITHSDQLDLSPGVSLEFEPAKLTVAEELCGCAQDMVCDINAQVCT
jgi:hypothetical protein